MRRLTALTIILVTALASFPAAWWAYDIWNDRRHTLTVDENTSVYTGKGNASCGGEQFSVIAPATKIQIRRIRYWKNCATIDVELADGRKGYIVPDRHNVTIIPSLR
jgi:hypothetical protein